MTEYVDRRSYEDALARIGRVRSTGRYARGEEHGQARFTRDEVRALRQKVIWKGQTSDEATITVAEAAAEFEVCLSTIYNILWFKTYQDVEDD